MVLWSPWWSVCVDSHKKFATFINKCNNLLAFSYAGLYTFNVNAICTSCGVLHSMTESGGPKSHLPPVAIWLTISNWHMRFHSWQEKAAASEIKNGLRVDIKQEDDIKLRTETARNRRMEERMLSLALHISPKCILFEKQNDLLYLLKLLLLGFCSCSKGNRLWDTGKTCSKGTAAGMINVDTDARYLRLFDST